MHNPSRLLTLLFLFVLLLPSLMLPAQEDAVSDIPQAQDEKSSDTPRDQDNKASEAPQAQDDQAAGMTRVQDPVSETLRQIMEGVEQEISLSVDACRYSSWPVMPRLYERREYRPIWTSPEKVNQFVSAIRGSYVEGLNPLDYNLNEILTSLEKNRVGRISDLDEAAFLDLLLTDAFIRLASNTLYGREDPAAHHPQWKNKGMVESKELVDYFEKLLAYPSLTLVVDSWKVHSVFYERMKQALATYRDIRAKGGWRRLSENTPLKMGDSGPGVLALRRRLADEYPGLGLPLGNPVFDDKVSREVGLFQARHSLKQDGVVGRETLMEMNVPVESRIDQIRINLERCRWMLRNLDNLFVLVDIVGFNVYVQHKGRIIWSGRAQVGQPYRDTPLLMSEITHIELNPAWTIPPTVRDQDILPAVKKDRSYLKKHNITIIDRGGLGFVIYPKEVKWALYPEQPFPFRLVQNPGEDNPLGRIKIMFPNKHRVYLHDTPSKFLFDQEKRTFSSGCIRVERPFELASLLFPDSSGWTRNKLKKEAAKGQTLRIDLPKPVPVLVMYITMVVDQKGVPFFRKDLYSHDPDMLDALGPDPYFGPG